MNFFFNPITSYVGNCNKNVKNIQTCSIKKKKKFYFLSTELKNKLSFILACSGILNQKVKDFSRLILKKCHTSVEYPPLLLHLCVFIDVIESLNVPNELMIFALRETDFMNFILKTNNNVLTVSSWYPYGYKRN